MKDGIYFEVFAVKDCVRYTMRVVDSNELSNTLVCSIMDGMEKIILGATDERN